MNRLARTIRTLLALLALLSYALLPVLRFEQGGVLLYMAGGLTLGLFFTRWMLLPLAALAALTLTAWMRSRGLRLACALISLASLALLGVWIAWMPGVLLPVDAAWLLEHATALRAVLERAGQADAQAMLASAWAADLPKPAWGYQAALACCAGAAFLSLWRDAGRTRGIRRHRANDSQ